MRLRNRPLHRRCARLSTTGPAEEEVGALPRWRGSSPDAECIGMARIRLWCFCDRHKRNREARTGLAVPAGNPEIDPFARPGDFRTQPDHARVRGRHRYGTEKTGRDDDRQDPEPRCWVPSHLTAASIAFHAKRPSLLVRCGLLACQEEARNRYCGFGWPV